MSGEENVRFGVREVYSNNIIIRSVRSYKIQLVVGRRSPFYLTMDKPYKTRSGATAAGKRLISRLKKELLKDEVI